jgi:hypothetical protein
MVLEGAHRYCTFIVTRLCREMIQHNPISILDDYAIQRLGTIARHFKHVAATLSCVTLTSRQ